jgi:hypothetical protein
MGYSHYFTMSKNTTEDQIAKMIKFANTAIELFGADQIANGMGDGGTKPQVEKEIIRLNGVEEDSHETFLLPFNSGEWEFCKTAQKPYDTLVVACLIFAEQNNVIKEWSSDGDSEDHEYGKALFEKANTLALSQNKAIEDNIS